MLRWSSAERERVVTILLGYVRHRQRFVKAWALDSLSRLAEYDDSLKSVVERLLQDFEPSESPALISRAKQIRRRLSAL